MESYTGEVVLSRKQRERPHKREGCGGDGGNRLASLSLSGAGGRG